MKVPNKAKIVAAFAIAVTLGLARDAAYSHVSDQVSDSVAIHRSLAGDPREIRLVYASVSHSRTETHQENGAGWNVKGSRDYLPASKDLNPEQ